MTKKERETEEIQQLREALHRQSQELRQIKAEKEALIKRYDNFYNFLPIGCLILNREGIIQQVNPAVADMLNCEGRHLLQRPFTEIIAPEQRAAGSAFLQKAFAGQTGKSLKVTLSAKGDEEKEQPWALLQIVNVKEDASECCLTLIDITASRKAEEELRRSREMLVEAQRVGRLGSWDWDARTDTIYWSEEYYRIYGFDPSQPPPGYEEHLKAYTSESAARLDAAVQKSMTTGEPYELDLERATEDGQRRWVTARGECKYDAAGQIIGLRGTAQDITAYKAIEEALRESEERFRVALKNSPVAVFNQDLDLRYTWIYNPLPHFNPEAALGKTDAEVFLPEEAKALTSIKRRALASGVTTRGEVQLTVNNHLLFFDLTAEPLRDAAGSVVGVTCAAVDITERKQAEKEMRKLQSAVEQTADSVVITDKKGVVEYVNPAFETLTGYRAGEALGKTPAILKSGRHTDAFYRELWETILAGRAFWAEFINRRKNGELYYQEGSISPVKNKDGEITHFVSTGRDVTSRKEAEAERERLHQNLQNQLTILQEAQERLVQSEKLAAVGELVSGVAHELNNPLGAVILYSQLLQRKTSDPGLQKDLATIVSQARRAGGIVRALLDFARQRPPERKETQINDVVAGALNLVAYELRKYNIEYVTFLAPDLPSVLADPHQLQQVFINLLNNACQAIHEISEEGKIIITTSVGPSQYLGAAAEDPTIRITIQDNGPGIPQEQISRIFDPFFTTKPAGQGTGLGLSVCHGIVSEHGGYIWAQSQEGQGATFFIELPIQQEEPTPPPEDAPAEEEAAPAALDVLIIDDELALRQVLARTLTREGYSVKTADNGVDGLCELERREYDLILCDLRMPGLSGPAFYQKVQEKWPHLTRRILFITGDTVSRDTNAFLEETGAACLTKPFEVSNLLHAINEQLARESH